MRIDDEAMELSICYPLTNDGSKTNYTKLREVFKINIKELLELADKQKRNKERIKSSRKFAVGISIVTAIGVAAGIVFAIKCGKEARDDLKSQAEKTAKSIKDTVHKKAETVNDSTAHAAKEATDIIKDIQGKDEDVKKDMKDGCQNIKQNIHRTAENVSDDLK